MQTNYQDAVRNVRRYLAQEAKAKQSALLWAFKIGRTFWWDILGGKSHVRDQNARLKHFANDIGKSPAVLNTYKLFYLGARSENNIRQYPLRKDQYERIGRYLPGEDFISHTLRLQFYGFLTKHDLDEDQLKKALHLANEAVDELPWNPLRKDLERPLQETKIGKKIRLELLVKEEDVPKLIATQKRLISLGEEIWMQTGHKLGFSVTEGGITHATKQPDVMTPDQTFEAMRRERQRGKRIKEIQKSASDASKKWTGERLFHGKAEVLLKDGALFPQRSIAICLTDPPYGPEFYHPWRPHTELKHDSPPSSQKCAELTAHIADIILSRKINMERFAWYSFCPLNAVSIFLPPLLEVFQKHRKDCPYDVLVWDKQLPPKAGGDVHFSLDAEAILYFSIDRPLATTTLAGKKTKLQSRIIREMPVEGFWKPPGLMAQLIHLSTHSEKEVVLDPFCGNGSTGIGAMLAGREFRLVESNAERYKVAEANILGALKTAPAP